MKKRIKNILLIILLLLVLVGAVLVGKRNKQRIINNNVKNEVPVQFLIGGGNEPGWAVSLVGFPSNKTEVNANLVLDYADTAWTGLVGRTWQKSYDKDFQYRGDLKQVINGNQLSSTTKNIILYFKKEECHDDADKVHGYKVELDFNSEKTYTGCADLK